MTERRTDQLSNIELLMFYCCVLNELMDEFAPMIVGNSPDEVFSKWAVLKDIANVIGTRLNKRIEKHESK